VKREGVEEYAPRERDLSKPRRGGKIQKAGCLSLGKDVEGKARGLVTSNRTTRVRKKRICSEWGNRTRQ